MPMARVAHGAISFRPVGEDDLALLASWLAAPHVARWWGEPADGVAEIREAMAEPSTEPYLILLDGRPVGYIQSYDIHAEADHPYRDQPPGTVGIDISIGEAALLGQGLGPRVIDLFVRRLFASGVPQVVIDPDPDNAPAIRAYEKAGFREFDRRTTQYGPALMMARRAEDHTRVS
jgi:aminoglycoside 6'-N-acetyltransferase